MISLIKNIIAYIFLLFLFGFIANFISINIDKDYIIKDDINILIIGASDTKNAIDDDILDDSINLSDHGRPNYINYLILKKILNDNQNIDTIIYGLSKNNIDSQLDKRWLDTRAKYLARILKYSDFDDLIVLIKYSPFLFSRTLLSSVINLFVSLYDPIDFGGYVKHEKNDLKKEPFLQINENDFSKKSMQKQYMEKIIKYCKRKNVELIFLRTPKYNKDEINNFNQSKEFFASFIKNFEDAKYIDHSGFFLEDSCYADRFHLNYRGAKIYSNYLNNIDI